MNHTTSLTFKTIAEQCLTHMSITEKPSTTATYYNAYKNHIKPYFDNILITDIRLRDFDKLIIDLSSIKNLSSKSICISVTVLRHIFKYARTLGLDVIDPCLIKRPKVINRNIEILTYGEYQKLVNYCLANPSNPSLGILLSLFTGIRIGEICALQWKDIDKDTDLLHISKTIQRVTNTSQQINPKTVVIIGPPKSESSNRYIPIANCIKSYLEERRQNDNIYVVSGSIKYYEPRHYRMIYSKILNDASIPHYPYHSLRHTFATRCVYLGFDPKTLSEILGHSDVAITFSTYVHPSLDAMKQDMKKLTLH